MNDTQITVSFSETKCGHIGHGSSFSVRRYRFGPTNEVASSEALNFTTGEWAPQKEGCYLSDECMLPFKEIRRCWHREAADRFVRGEPAHPSLYYRFRAWRFAVARADAIKALAVAAHTCSATSEGRWLTRKIQRAQRRQRRWHPRRHR